MKYCKKCSVSIGAPRKQCPLCQGELVDKHGPEQEVFPHIPTVYKQFNLFFRILIFLSILTGVTVLGINMLTRGSGGWSLIVLGGIGYMWVTIIATVHKKNNISKTILYQVVLFSVAAIGADLLSGWGRWSVNYVIPMLCVFAMFAIAIIARVMNHTIDEYVVYLLIDGIFGVVPLVLVLTNAASVVWPSLVSVAVSVLFLSAILLFARHDIWGELKRRLHL